jgi:RimJ/RimL family protein N-acetyltransferase
MKNYKSFETGRLIIRPTTEADAGFAFELMTSPKWLANIGSRGLQSPGDAARYIRDRILPQFERLGFGNYTVIRKTDGAKMGVCGLHDREGLNGIDIGYAFLEQYEGQGYAIEAARCIKQAAIEDFLLTEIYAITTHGNVASQRILEKLGLKYVTTVQLEGDDEELRLYLLKVTEA